MGMTKKERIEKLTEKLAAMKAHEDELRAQGCKYIGGIDEVGRGPLAGPVYAACVILPPDFDVLGVDDSKKVSEKKRNELDRIIREQAIAYGIGIATAKEIDELNILNATKLAMTRAIEVVNEKLKEKTGDKDAHLDLLLIDAVHLDVPIRQESIIKGDARCLSIAAASIVAKVARDNYMAEMDDEYPGYSFGSNKGYGTAAHYEGIREFGITPIHRKTFLKNFDEKHAKSSEEIGRGRSEMAKKYYAVRVGRIPGVYTSWDDCKEQVTGFKGAIYKGFTNEVEAIEFIGVDKYSAQAIEKTDNFSGGDKSGYVTDADIRKLIDTHSAYAFVDGSYENVTRRFSCGVVIIDGKGEVLLKEAFSDPESSDLRNVAGEVMGARKAVEYAIEQGYNKITIFHDYTGISEWANDKWKANLKLTREYKEFIRDKRQHIDIEFVKVPAHSGVRYNEIADRLAKAALGIL